MNIVEVLRRSDQGITEPFICRAEDGMVYFVKGKSLPRRQLVSELVCAELANRFGLNSPDHCILFAPKGLVEIQSEMRLGDLGYGPVFGSLAHEGCVEISFEQGQQVSHIDRQKIAVFDFWVGNGDRILSELGGNPNLLIEVSTGHIIEIDHNLAFDFGITLEGLAQNHIFKEELIEAARSKEIKHEYIEKIEGILLDWPEIAAKIPDEWFYMDYQQTVDVDFELDEMRHWLVRLTKEDGWL